MVNVADFRTLRRDDTILVPPMDPITAAFTAAVFRSLGYRSEVLEENVRTLETGLKHTTGGECLPCPSTMGAMLHALSRGGIDPARAVFFMPTTCGPCRFGQYSILASLAFDRCGWKGVRVLSLNSENNYGGLKGRGRRLLWHAVVLSDVYHKIILKARPYETERGAVDALAAEWIARMIAEIEKPSSDLRGVLRGFAAAAAAVPRVAAPRPKVAVVGEIYIRNNPFTNERLVATIEALGGEVFQSTIGEWILYCAEIERINSIKPQHLRRNRLWLRVESAWFHSVERMYIKAVKEYIPDRGEPSIRDVIAAGRAYVPPEFQSEAILTVGRAVLFITQNAVEAVVNAAPMFCMPGTISASLFARIEKEYGVPVISIFYDGSGAPNQVLAPYMHYLVERAREARN